MERVRRILIVDDERDFCDFVKMALETADDFKVSVCSDSLKAVECVRELRPDLLLLDLMMPGVGGSQIADELRNNSDTQDIPIIFLTALVTEEETKENRSVIAGSYFISKPVEIKRLVFLINSLLGFY